MKNVSEKVIIAMVVVGGIIILALIAAVTLLVKFNANPAPLLTLLGTIISAISLLVAFLVKNDVGTIREQTNGTQSKLINAVIGSPAVTTGQTDQSVISSKGGGGENAV